MGFRWYGAVLVAMDRIAMGLSRKPDRGTTPTRQRLR